MRGGFAPVAFGRDDRLDIGLGDLFADGVRVISFVGKESFDPDGDHPEQGGKTLRIVRLSGRQHEAKRAAFGIASGMKFCGEAATRSAKRLGFLSPLFMPTAQ